MKLMMKNKKKCDVKKKRNTKRVKGKPFKAKYYYYYFTLFSVYFIIPFMVFRHIPTYALNMGWKFEYIYTHVIKRIKKL